MDKEEEIETIDPAIEEGWNEYRNAVTENKNKSQDDFEKYINLLASGGIILSLTFLEKIATIVKIEFIWFYIIGLILLVATLLSNLYSHYRSIQDADLIIKEIDDKKYEDIFKNSDARNQKITLLNKTSIWSLIIGAFLILTFVSINLYIMNNNQKPTTPRENPTQHPKPLTEETGRTNPSPSPQIKPSNTPKK